MAVVAAATGVAPRVASAGTSEWLGTYAPVGISGAWSDAENWLFLRVPDANDDVVFPGALNTQSTNDLNIDLNEIRFVPRNGLSASYIVNGISRVNSIRNTTDDVQRLQYVRNVLGLTIDNQTGVSSAGRIEIQEIWLSRYLGPLGGGLITPRLTFVASSDGIDVTGGIFGRGNAFVKSGVVRVVTSTSTVDYFDGNWTVSANATLVGQVSGSGQNTSTSLGDEPTKITLENNAELDIGARAMGADGKYRVNQTHALTVVSGAVGNLRAGPNYITTYTNTIAGSVNKVGPGEIRLSNVPTSGSSLRVGNGAVTILSGVGNDAASALSALTVETGTNLTFTERNNVSAASLGGGGTINLGASVDPTARVTLFAGGGTFAGQVTGTGRFAVSDAGNVSLSGATNNYTGGTAVGRNGSLSLFNTSGNSTGTGPITLDVGARLAGSGISRSAVTVLGGTDLTTGFSAIVSPNASNGASTGTLTVGGLAFQGAGGSFRCDINGTVVGSTIDRVIVNGNVNLTNGTLDLRRGADFARTTPLGASTLVDVSGTRTGVFASVLNVRLTDETSFAVTYDGSDVNVRVALVADPNLDGQYTFADFLLLAPVYRTGAANQTWVTGDLSGNGLVDLDDLRLLAGAHSELITEAQYNQLRAASYQEWYDLRTIRGLSVPEPASLIALAVPAMIGLRRRRTR